MINFSYFYLPEAYTEPRRTYTMERLVKIVNDFKSLTVFTKKLHR